MCECKHKHYECIVAWASGEKIQVRSNLGLAWEDVSEPGWFEQKEYRIKPEPKPDVVRFAAAEAFRQRSWRDEDDNVKYTYDGETGKLKSVEMI